ncbi:MAG: RIP metalloprotease RseP [Deltaproteobacteria bacterium]|nr:RIP metalloprotease RseP [Deltaproteobacteria bacterium]
MIGLATLLIVLQVVIVFGMIVFVHELGHFLAAKFVGVGVERFSLGFGPKIFGKQVGDTEYMICAVPLGGYVKMVGDEVGDDAPPADIEKSFSHQSLPGRFLIVSAGALFNLICAVVVFTVLFVSFGVHVPLDIPRIGGVMPDLPAAKAGLEKGDDVLSVAGSPVKTWKEMAEKIEQSKGQAIPFVVKKAKDGSTVELTVQPELRDDPVNGGKKFAIGVGADSQLESVSLGRAMSLAVQETWMWSKLIFQNLAMLVTGNASPKELGGPILIFQEAGRQAKLGLDYLLRFAAIINVNLAIFNLLPIPILDGGHLLFFSIEAVLGRPPSLRARELATRFGFLVILTLIVFVMYNDIARIVTG